MGELVYLVFSCYENKTIRIILCATFHVSIRLKRFAFSHESRECFYTYKGFIQPSIKMASRISFLFILPSLYSVYGLPEYCYNYYSEFALDEHYNPAIYPEINTTITDITTLYKVSEVGLGRSVNR